MYADGCLWVVSGNVFQELKRQMGPSMLLWLPFGSYLAEAMAGFSMRQFQQKFKDVSDGTSFQQVILLHILCVCFEGLVGIKVSLCLAPECK